MTVLRPTFRPLSVWVDPETPDRQSGAKFRSSWADTLKFLVREAEYLDASSLVIQVVADEADLRQDGMLRTQAVVRHPGAVVSLDTPKGALRFATDAYEQRYYSDLPSWQATVRAIALGLAALRAVDRHRIGHRAEQYQGWLAIEPAASTSMAEAQAVIDSYGGQAAALRATHPDHGGSREDFERVQQARTILREVPR